MGGDDMDPSDGIGIPEVEQPPVAPPDRLDYLEARVRMLEESVPKSHLFDPRFLPRAFAVLGHYMVAGFIVYLVALAAFLAIAALGFGVGSIGDLFGPDGLLDGDVPEGPRLESVSSLPMNASGVGTITGYPTGDMSSRHAEGSFVVVLDPAPAGLPDRTTLDVVFNHSTTVYRDGREQGDPLEAINSDDGPWDADPTDADTVVVRFHVKDGDVFADRIDLSNE
jgi:hypothetical protein